MEAHPIPQNVTSFQFKLVGDMTLKQFLYLAAGSALAYFLFLSLAPIYPFVAWPLIVISALFGVALAFLPISSRPLDHWLAAFFKAIYSPTKRVWRKGVKSYSEEPLFASRLLMYLSANYNPQAVQSTASTPVATPSTPNIPENLPTEQQLKKTVELAREAQKLQLKIIQSERTLSQIKQLAQRPTQAPQDYSQQVNKILADLQTLVSQASAIKEQLQSVTKTPGSEVSGIPPQLLPKEKVKIVIPLKPKQAQVALTSLPNVINGIVKDKQGNFLEGVVSVIYDKEGLPVRALKTNKLGQFTGSTPLQNGTYTLELEKDSFTFDLLQIELNGGILPSLLITAK